MVSGVFTEQFGVPKVDYLPPTDLSISHHAYHTADYRVSKREMAALYQRYYSWKSWKDKQSQREYTSVTHMDGSLGGTRRAYQTSSFESTPVILDTKPLVRHSHGAKQHVSYAATQPTKRRPAYATRLNSTAITI